jgi:hypothetical protein
VVYALVGVFVLITVTAGLIFALLEGFGATHHGPRATPMERIAQTPPSPRLESNPKTDLAAVRAQEDAHLSGYGWSDRQAGLAHIPIERAMQLEVQRGWTDTPSGAAK